MKPFAFAIVIAVLSMGDAADACGRCRTGHSRKQRVAYASRPASYQAPAAYGLPATSPQMTYAQPVMAQQPTALPTAPVGVQPAYAYTAADQERPAYYYTYDESGKLIVAQWMDWLFRGGRAEGMPRPPLPVIGALGGRNR